jgi:uncharacterized protein YqfA (UPF0365 family)
MIETVYNATTSELAIIPFILVFGSIAVFPLFASHFRARNKKLRQATAEGRCVMAVAQEQEMRVRVQEMQAKVGKL